jgi:hypothetical protein
MGSENAGWRLLTKEETAINDGWRKAGGGGMVIHSGTMDSKTTGGMIDSKVSTTRI